MEFGKLIGLYEYFYSKVYHFDYQYKHSHNHDVTIQNFLDKIDVSYGEDWVFYYLAFQFEYWFTKKYRKTSGVAPNLVFGQKAIERFKEKNENWRYFIDKFLQAYQIDNVQYYKKDLVNISIAEENEKLRFKGRERFANCILHTTLYNRKSKICIFCNFSNNCKKAQKTIYPNIYKLRNETKFESISV